MRNTLPIADIKPIIQPGPGTAAAEAMTNLLATALYSLWFLLFKNVRKRLNLLLCLSGAGLCCCCVCGLGGCLLSGRSGIGRSNSMPPAAGGGGVGVGPPMTAGVATRPLVYTSNSLSRSLFCSS